MRRLLLLLAVLVIAIPGILFLVWDAQTRALGNTLVADFTAAKARVITRTPVPRAPLHENGYQCLGQMLDVTAPDYGPFGAPELADFITGKKPITELSPDVRARMLKFSPWAVTLRGCAESLELRWVDGLSPWAPPTHPRQLRLAGAIPALIDFTALELRVLLGDGQPEVALERCTATWATVADQSHLGLVGARHARKAASTLAPACGEALAKAPAEAKAQIARQWPHLRNRLAPVKELIEAERLGSSVRTFAWVSSEAITSQLPGVVAPGTSGLMSRIAAGRTWRAREAALRALAQTSGAERTRAADAIEPGLGQDLTAYEETFVLFELLADLAAGGSKPLPAGVTRTEQGLEFASADGQKLVIPK